MMSEKFENILELQGMGAPNDPELPPGVRRYLMSAIRYAENGLETSSNSTRAIRVFNESPAAGSSATPNAGPRSMVSEMCKRVHSVDDVDKLRKQARINVVLRNSKRSRGTKLSGNNCWADFAKRVLRYPRHDDFPKTHLDILLWSETFRSAGTFSNYLGAVKSACLMLGHPTHAFEHELVRRAVDALKKTSVKREVCPPVGLELLTKLVGLAEEEGDSTSAVLYLLSYWFLLRVPSEGLPARFGSDGTPIDQRTGKTFYFKDGGQTICMEADRRKNKDEPTDMWRRCVCKRSATVCPVHATAGFFETEAYGNAPFERITPRFFNASLRRRIQMLGVAKHQTFTSKTFRRGHTQDIHRRGGTAYEILMMGQWTGRTFRDYLTANAIHDAAFNPVAAAESSSEGESASDSDN